MARKLEPPPETKTAMRGRGVRVEGSEGALVEEEARRAAEGGRGGEEGPGLLVWADAASGGAG
jgi:hypothetical protein